MPLLENSAASILVTSAGEYMNLLLSLMTMLLCFGLPFSCFSFFQISVEVESLLREVRYAFQESFLALFRVNLRIAFL